MELLYIVFTAIGSIITLFILTKIMGNKQMSQLSMFDYIIGNLKYTGNNIDWLYKQLQIQGINNVSDIFLATCDNENNLSVYPKIKKKMTRDIFQ
ncbi:MAG: YetF domain-containing protein [Anaerovoracaceae bacterium]|jgi:uncharacterized membrane protein YcaP (DUF421 family)|nr:hypothetical protein [Clostridiales bacterium]